MRKDWAPTQDAFDGLLGWLDPNRERAGEKYETLRLRLIKIFTCRGCRDAEGLADETIDRVMAKVNDVAGSYSGDPALYFYGVAQKVHLESLRKAEVHQVELAELNYGRNQSPELDNDDAEYQCLDRCLENLSSESRDLVIRYYQREKRAKIDHRKQLAQELGIAVNALRIRAHRIRLALQQCVQHCLAELPAN
jgi:DNA-directed RNA polymerase specialized sigma24 family protein